MDRIPYLSIAFIFFTFTQSCRNTELPVARPICTEVDGKIETLKIYLETSLSMRGYIATNDYTNGVFSITKKLPLLISRLQSISIKNKLYTVSDKPDLYTEGLDKYNEMLFNGTIFKDSQSKLQNCITSIIDSLEEEEVGIFISDCIIDLGEPSNNGFDQVTTQIHSHLLKNNRNVAAVVLQYYSDFNGDYYYNRNNNKTSEKERRNPYKGLLMHKRPYYLWLFGNKNNLKELLKKNTFSEGLINSYSYGLNYSYCDIKYQFVQYETIGRISIDKKDATRTTLLFRDFDKNNKISFTIGLDLSTIPQFARTKEYLEKNLSLSPNYIKYKIDAIHTINELVNDSKYNDSAAPMLIHDNLTHFITFCIEKPKEAKIVREYELIINKENESWIDMAHISDDTDLSLEKIENKTYGLYSITNAFEQAFEDNNILLKIPFTIKKR